MMGMIQLGSSGIGPTFPIRVGLESDYGFLDIGLQAAFLVSDTSPGGGMDFVGGKGLYERPKSWYPLVLPELRMGFSF